MKFEIYTFEQLTVNLLYEILKLRSQVFVVEQECVFLDMDDRDQVCQHLCLYVKGELVGYARIMPPNVKYEESSLGRFILKEHHRGGGMGRLLVQEALARHRDLFGSIPILIEAQAQLEKFYASFGFKSLGKPYMYEGRDHVKMVLSI